MSWSARVRDAFSGEEGQKRHSSAALLAIYNGFLARRAQLLLHADKAPAESSAAALRALADALGSTAGWLRQALDARAVTVRPGVPPSEAATGMSHWARIVADLEAQQAARDEILLCAARFADSDPEAGALLDVLLEHVEDHCGALRSEIARADPQALD